MHITIVLGTARKERKSERVFTVLGEAFRRQEQATVEMVDVRDHVTIPETIPNWGVGGADEVPTKWKDIVAETDSFVFVLPEYNHGYPGEWKLLVDSLFAEYAGKKAYIVGVSGGSFSGVRVSDHVKPILVELNFNVQKTGLYVGSVTDTISEDGEVADEKFSKRVRKFVDEVAGV